MLEIKRNKLICFISFVKPMYEYFSEQLRNENIKVENGIFQADMQVSLINDGPVTFILEK